MPTNAETIQTWLLLLNFDRICSLPTNRVATIALVDDILEIERGGPEPAPSPDSPPERPLSNRERELSQQIVEALHDRLRGRINVVRSKATSPLDQLLPVRLPTAGHALDEELDTLLSAICASVEVSASIVPVHGFDRQIVDELISADS